MGKIYTIANRKGGCSKTVTTGALAAGLTHRGYKVLAVDMDTQADLTCWTGCDPDLVPTMFEVFGGKKKIEDVILHYDRYDLLPADITLSMAQDVVGKDKVKFLRKALLKVADKYDFIFIDTPPSLDFLTLSALMATTGGVIIPTDTGRFATRGMNDLDKSIQDIIKTGKIDIRYCGVLITRYSGRYNYAKQATALTKRFSEFIDAPLFETVIRYSGDIPLAVQESKDIYTLDRKNAGVDDYSAFVDEFLYKEGYSNEKE